MLQVQKLGPRERAQMRNRPRGHNIYSFNQPSNRSFEEFGATTAATDTSTTGLTDSQVQKWFEKIHEFGALQMRFNQPDVIATNTEMLDKNTEKVTIMKEGSKLDITTTNPGEAFTGMDNRTATEITNLDTVDVDIGSTTNWYMGFITVSKQMMLTNVVDLAGYARKALAYAYAVDVEEAIADVLQGTTITNIVWGGDAGAVEELTAGDTFTADHVAEMRQMLLKNNFTPKYLFITSYALLSLEKDSVFTNASEYGDDSVVKNGFVKRYLGVDIILTECSSLIYAEDAVDINESTDTYDLTAGHVAIMIGNSTGGQPPAVICWKEKLKVSFEYIMDSASHRFYSDYTFATALIHKEGVVLGKFSQS